MGLKDDQLFCSVTPDDCRRPVAEFINHILALCHSDFYIDVEDSKLPPIRKHADAPAHHQPTSSTCCSNELTPSGPPSLSPVLRSSSLILSRPSAAPCSNRLEAVPRSSQPAAAPRSEPTAPIMASHICHKNNMDQYGLLSPSSPLFPSSPPEPERPPEPVPPERPPEPAPPDHPLVPAPPKPGPPVLSCRKFGGGATPLIHHGRLDCLLGHGFPSSLILHGCLDCVLLRGSLSSLTRHGSLSSLIIPGG
ncbi:hypothetical protein M9458_008572, partial [Cirrhinus mrigala]